MSAARDWLEPRRRVLQLAFGMIWLLDAALQFQSYMFTPAFPHQVIAPVGPGNPGWIADPVRWSAHLAATHVVALNAAFAMTQLLIALGLFTRATVRLALVGSVLWALGVWWMGEGLGGLLAGAQSPVMGAPGAAVLYVLISALLWPGSDPLDAPVGAVATPGRPRALAARLAWLALWSGFALESLQAANRSPSALHDAVAGMAAGEPRWLQAVDHGAAAALAHRGTEASIALAVAFGLVALSVLGNTALRRVGLTAAIVLAVVIWVVGQNFGEIATGSATDPNTGPLLVLLAAVYWPIVRRTAAPDAAAHPAAVDRQPMLGRTTEQARCAV